MLEKLQETLKSDSESLMLKAAEDSTKSHAYAIEAKSIMDECQQVVEIEKLTDTINSLEKKCKEFWFWLLIFFELVNCFCVSHSMWNPLNFKKLPTWSSWILFKFCQVNVSIKKWKSWKFCHFITCSSEIMTTWNMELLAWIPNH